MKKKILFIIPSLAGGGAERILVELLKNLNREKFVLFLILFNKEGKYLDQIPEDVTVYDLNKKNKLDFFKLIFKLAFKIFPKVRPDAAVSFLNYTNIVTVISKMFSFSYKPKIIISQRDYLSLSMENIKFSTIKLWLIKILYPKADKIVAISEGIKNDLNKSFLVNSDNIQVIHNGIDISFIQKEAEESIEGVLYEGITIVACGRLNYQKNYPLLLQAFSKVANKTEVRLLIFGEGEEREKIEKLILNLGLQDKVELMGFRKNPFKYIAKADIFVISSLSEGFGNVIVEAMICKTAVISTNCPSGPGEIIDNGKSGLLVRSKDVQELERAIMRLIEDENLRSQLAQRGHERAKDFNIKKSVKEYEKVFFNV